MMKKAVNEIRNKEQVYLENMNSENWKEGRLGYEKIVF